MKSLFAISTLVIAAIMLFIAIQFISKNSPKLPTDEVRRLPPTSPNSHSNTTRSHSNESVNNYIGGVGIIEPVGEATVIGSQLPGVVEEICVKPGDVVEAGAPLIKLDQRSSLADLEVAKADLAESQSKLNELLAQIPTLRARLAAAQALEMQAAATESNAKKEFERASTVGFNALSEEEVDTRRLNWETAKAKHLETIARVQEASASLLLYTASPSAPTIEVQKGAVMQAEANVKRASTNLELRTITAPKAGTILSVKIRVGEFVPASVISTPFMTLGVINPLHIRVDIDESEIPRFHPGANAYASVRGRPEIKIPIQYVRTEPLVVPKRSLTGTVSERVDTRVLQVIYSADPTKLDAEVGQQVDVYIEEHTSK